MFATRKGVKVVVNNTTSNLRLVRDKYIKIYQTYREIYFPLVWVKPYIKRRTWDPCSLNVVEEAQFRRLQISLSIRYQQVHNSQLEKC